MQTNAFIVDELVRREIFQRESRIVFVSSIRDRIPWKGQLIYSAGKAAGESMCRTWAEAFGGKYEEVCCFLYSFPMGWFFSGLG